VEKKMKFGDVINSRRSIRKYKSDDIPKDYITEILNSARIAPSGSNKQPWHFIVVNKKEIIQKLGLPKWANEAPVIIVCCVDPLEGRWYIIDGSIAFEHLILSATNLGLGTCWIGRFYENLGETDERIKKILNVPEHMRVLAVTPLGYPAEEPGEKYRKKLTDITHYNNF
jgi:nitroreductase